MMAAEINRVLSTPELLHLIAGAAKTPLPVGIPLQGRIQFLLVKLRPEDFREIQLCIGQLPEEEIADATFPARTDKQVRLRQIREAELCCQCFSGDITLCSSPPATLSATVRQALAISHCPP